MHALPGVAFLKLPPLLTNAVECMTDRVTSSAHSGHVAGLILPRTAAPPAGAHLVGSPNGGVQRDSRDAPHWFSGGRPSFGIPIPQGGTLLESG